MSEADYKSLLEYGWTEFKSGSTDFELTSIAVKIGNILKHPNGQEVFTLRPKLKTEALAGSFSNKHGLGDFPLHTDTAFYKNPARYILMHSSEPNNCDTVILRKIDFWNLLTAHDKKMAERAIYVVSTNREKYYTSFIFKMKNEYGIKYDPSCMIPFNRSAKEFDQIFQKTISEVQPIRIKWQEGKTIILDNWKNLHGRKSAEKDTSRVLKRIYIN